MGRIIHVEIPVKSNCALEYSPDAEDCNCCEGGRLPGEGSSMWGVGGVYPPKREPVRRPHIDPDAVPAWIPNCIREQAFIENTSTGTLRYHFKRNFKSTWGTV
ncbi:hypothetical protein J6590_075882 [Homalodisca vitripennis]|nr:hypothetical protein J6590_075882 [Homalodisca vitripennis]